MAMSDGVNRLKKIAFQIGEKFFRFAINPDNMQISRPHRTTALKTKSRIVIEDFQSDIPTITIEGTTGWNPTGRASDRGIAKIKEMKRYLEEYAEMGGNGRTSEQDFIFHDFTNDDSFVVHLSPEGVTYTQDAQAPLLHRYRIKFIILRRASDPSDEDVIEPEIGTSSPSIGSGGNGGAVPMPEPLIPDRSVPMPEPLIPDRSVPMPEPIIPNTGVVRMAGGYFYNESMPGQYVPERVIEPINPQNPSTNAYKKGMEGIGYLIGHYGGRYTTL